LLDVLREDGMAIVRVVRRERENNPEGHYNVLDRHLVPLRDKTWGDLLDSSSSAVYVDNWIRLGLVGVSYEEYLSAGDAYDWVNEHPNWIAAREKYASDTVDVDFDRGHMVVTSLGHRFLAAVS
jgi:hypothetical protein